MQLCSVTRIDIDNVENTAFITLYIPQHATTVSADDCGEFVSQAKGKYTSLTAPGLCEPRYLQLPSDKEKQAAYRKLEARFSRIRQNDLRHVSYAVQMKIKTLEYFCDQVNKEQMLAAAGHDLERYCIEVREGYLTCEEMMEEFLAYLNKPFERAKMSAIKSRATQMLEEEKLAVGMKEHWKLDVGRLTLSKDIHGLLKVIECSRAEVSKMRENLIIRILAAVTSYERESATWIEVFDDVTRGVLDN